MHEGILNFAEHASPLARWDRLFLQDAARRSGTSLVDALVRQVSRETPRQVDGGTRYVIRFEV